jgi:hypothetical protein
MDIVCPPMKSVIRLSTGLASCIGIFVRPAFPVSHTDMDDLFFDEEEVSNGNTARPEPAPCRRLPDGEPWAGTRAGWLVFLLIVSTI